MLLYIAGIVEDSVVDGPGWRMTVFAQGCPHHCVGCHNQHTWPFETGEPVETAEIAARLFKNPMWGLTLSGGEPFAQAAAMAELAAAARQAGRHVVAYTGYGIEQLCEDEHLELLRQLDWLIDGPYIQAQHTLALPYRGSKNQRVIDVQSTLAQGKTVLLEI